MLKKVLFLPIIITSTFCLHSYAGEVLSSDQTVNNKNVNNIKSADKASVNEKSIIQQTAQNVVKQALQTKIAKLNDFSANFSQTVFDADGHELQKSSGNLAVSKPNLLHWQVTEPNESLIVSDGKALWLYDPFIEQVSVYSVNGAMTNTPILLLANPEPSIWQSYNVELISENRYLIKSIDTNSQVKSLELAFVNKKDTVALTEFVILDATGQLSRVKLTNFRALAADKKQNLFHFDLPQDVEIDDQR